MLNSIKRVESISLNNAQAIRKVYPQASWNDMIKLQKYGTIEDITACKALYPEASIKDLTKLVQGGTYQDIEMIKAYYADADIKDLNVLLTGRRFSRWYADNKKVIKKLSMLTPAFALALHGLTGGLALTFFGSLGSPAIVAFAAPVTSIPAFPASEAVSAFSTLGAAGGTVPTSFFGGKGAILLHMLVAGFVSLVVCSFLKFTGRGDLIPLVAFVGGGIILYEVIGLFTDIYGAIRTMLQM